jgi:hypothetical protein
MDVQEPKLAEQLFVLKISDDMPQPEDSHIFRIHEVWRSLFHPSPAPPLVILSPGMELRTPLPGKYAFHERYEEREVTTTFQTYEELCVHIRAFMPKFLPNWAGATMIEVERRLRDSVEFGSIFLSKLETKLLLGEIDRLRVALEAKYPVSVVTMPKLTDEEVAEFKKVWDKAVSEPTKVLHARPLVFACDPGLLATSPAEAAVQEQIRKDLEDCLAEETRKLDRQIMGDPDADTPFIKE